MKKKEIKKILGEMKIKEQVSFFSKYCDMHRQDIVIKKNNCFSIFSQGQNWEDKTWEDFDKEETLKILWESKPHSCFKKKDV